jgi:hypothetical protein
LKSEITSTQETRHFKKLLLGAYKSILLIFCIVWLLRGKIAGSFAFLFAIGCNVGKNANVPK